MRKGNVPVVLGMCELEETQLKETCWGNVWDTANTVSHLQVHQDCQCHHILLQSKYTTVGPSNCFNIRDDQPVGLTWRSQFKTKISVCVDIEVELHSINGQYFNWEAGVGPPLVSTWVCEGTQLWAIWAFGIAVAKCDCPVLWSQTLYLRGKGLVNRHLQNCQHCQPPLEYTHFFSFEPSFLLYS